MSMCDYCINNGVCNQPAWTQKAVKNDDLYCEHFKVIGIPKISMNRTTSPFVTLNKSVTRRHWQPVTIKRFKKDTKFLAVQRCYGGEALGIGQLTEDTFKENTGVHISASSIDRLYKAEGFEYLDSKYNKITNALYHRELSPLWGATVRWKKADVNLTVVPFKVIEVFPGMLDKYTSDEEIIRCVKALVKAIG